MNKIIGVQCNFSFSSYPAELFSFFLGKFYSFLLLQKFQLFEFAVVVLLGCLRAIASAHFGAPQYIVPIKAQISVLIIQLSTGLRCDLYFILDNTFFLDLLPASPEYPYSVTHLRLREWYYLGKGLYDCEKYHSNLPYTRLVTPMPSI